MFFRHLCCT